jgi:hypothetical protein
MRLYRLVVWAIVLAISTASADTVRTGATELSLPDEGWFMRTENGHTLLAAEKGGAIIEIYDFSKVPANDKAALTALVDNRQDTDDVVIESAGAHSQHGLKGITFRGRAKIKGRPVSFSCIALGVRSRAALAIAFIVTPGSPVGREATDILASLKGVR